MKAKKIKKQTVKAESRKKAAIKKKTAPARIKPAKLSLKTKKIIIAGLITHYFPKVKAAAVKLKNPLKLGEAIHIKGHTTDFKQNVTSMQVNKSPIKAGKKGEEIGLLVDSRVRRGDIVYRKNI